MSLTSNNVKFSFLLRSVPFVIQELHQSASFDIRVYPRHAQFSSFCSLKMGSKSEARKNSWLYSTCEQDRNPMEQWQSWQRPDSLIRHHLGLPMGSFGLLILYTPTRQPQP